MRRHPVLAWSFAWGVAGVALLFGGAPGSPRSYRILVSIVLGAAAWGFAGRATIRNPRPM